MNPMNFDHTHSHKANLCSNLCLGGGGLPVCTSGKYPRQEWEHGRVDGDKQTFASLVVGNCFNIYTQLASYCSGGTGSSSSCHGFTGGKVEPHSSAAVGRHIFRRTNAVLSANLEPIS